jgi:radical SAM protein (TIGR01212 family)
MTQKSSRYRRFSDFLTQKFRCKVYKISLDAGMSCPNRDGTLSRHGCIFCDPGGGSGRQAEKSPLPISEQIHRGMEDLKKKYKAEKFIAYFQTFTNTYGPVEKLRHIYDQALIHEDIIGLSIATRPDCISPEALDLISTYTEKYHVWIELGIQSMRPESLVHIERGHGVPETITAIQAVKKRNIPICAHLILGLPGENLQDMTATAQKVSDLGVDAVKLHMLYITSNSRLAPEYHAGRIPLLSKEEYIAAAVRVLEILAPDIVIQRMVSEAHADILIAPEWLKNKLEIVRLIEEELEKRDTWQGKNYRPK